MILNVRGWYGSGKSTLVRRLLDEHNGREIGKYYKSSSKSKSFRVYEASGNLYVVGYYGGEPGTPGTGDLVNGAVAQEVVSTYSRNGFVIFENVNASSRHTWLEFFIQEKAVLAALDTPFEECIRRIYERRERTGRNVGRALKLETRQADYALVTKELNRAAAAGVRAYWLDHQGDTAYHQVRQLLFNEGWNPS